MTQMIETCDIHEGDLVTIDVEGEEIGLYAKVHTNGGRNLLVRYLVITTRFYKDAPVYKFEEMINSVDYNSLIEHYNEWTLDDFAVKKVGENLYVFEADICSDVSDSDIESSESEGSSLDDFVVDEDINEFPNDAREVDEQWNRWTPSTAGGRGFKRKIDEMEARYRHQNDEF